MAIKEEEGVGLFVSVEGCDRAGKSDLVRGLCEALEGRGLEVFKTREPSEEGGLREALRGLATGWTARAEALLFAASMAQSAIRIKEALGRGAIVVSDRYTDSAAAYQGWGRGLGEGEVRALTDFAVCGVEPELTLWLDLEPREAWARGAGGDRFEEEGLEFQERVREGYASMGRRDVGRIVRLDGRATREELVSAAMGELLGRLEARD